MWRLVVCFWLLAATPARAEHWPTAVHGTAEGLANDHVDHGVFDQRGYLWLATADGVSRFDGRDFANYGEADGLPSAAIAGVAPARDGSIWAATDHGLAVLGPGASRFRTVVPDWTSTVFEDPTGTLWAGVGSGLVRVDRDHGSLIAVPVRPGKQPLVMTMAYDPRDRSLWVGTDWGLVHRSATGAIDHYRVMPRADGDDRVFGITVDRHGLLWLGTVGTQIIAIPSRPGERLAPEDVSLVDLAMARPDWPHHVARNWARRGVFEDADGSIWIGTSGEVVRYDGHEFEDVTAELTGVGGGLAPIGNDVAGNLWFASETRGIVRFAPRGMVSYDEGDGVRGNNVHDFITGPDGALYVLSYDHGHVLERRDARGFTVVHPNVARDPQLGWGWNQAALIDRDGRWWLTTGAGLARFPAGTTFEALATATPEFFERIGELPGRDMFRIYEDRHGDVWITVLGPLGIGRWDRATNTFHGVGAAWPHGLAYAYGEDASGALWVGFERGTVARWRDGALLVLGRDDGIPEASVMAVLGDARGRVWLATTGGGLLRIDDPAASHPHVRRYTRADGLASDQVQSLIDDEAGRIYVGTLHGVDRLDPATGAIVHLDAADGLPAIDVATSVRASDGSLWFGTPLGAARYVVSQDPPVVAPTTVLEKVSRPLDRPLGPDENQLDLAFSAPSFAGPVRFQYRINAGAWSPPSPERALHFAQLEPGSYRIEIRAVLGTAAGPAAAVAFEIRPPLYLRAWFLVLVALAVAAATYALYRWRLAHLLAVERVRSRIASDLHDEIGSSLSRISILSELASRRAAAREDVHPQIRVIGTSARELLDAASDIVWSTDPRRDDLGSVIVRLRAFASDVLESRGIAWTLDAPPDPDRIKLDPERRRHVYLVLKEAIHNAARHSSARRVDISIRATGTGLVASVRDDGSGFVENALPGTGNGLANMRARAAQAGGNLEIHHDAGTEIVLRL